uniref:family 10 glycosylhydrolase n=1 Tax=Eubacterium sp. TaxID=142586 RepID=UPI004025F017
MYKKIILSIFLVFCLAGCTFTADNSKINENADNQNTYVKSVFIAYYELSEFTKNSDKKSFTKSISKAFKELSNKGFNRVTVQVRPCADAFYNSSYFPTSEYCFGYQGAKLIYDPLEIMVQIAHKYNLSVEAWINPYRVCQRNDFNSLAKNNIALEWQGTDKLIVLD